MKNKLFALFVMLILVVSFAFNSVPALASEIYLALGDSISTGYGLDDINSGFANRLADANGYTLYNHAENGSTAADVLEVLESGDIDDVIESAQIITLTCGGNDMMRVLYEQVAEVYNKTADVAITAEDVSAILSDSEDKRQMALALRAFVVLSGNGDDILPISESEIFDEARNQYQQQLEKIIRCLRERNQDARIIVTTQYNPYKTFSGSFSVLNTRIGDCVKKLNNVIISNSDSVGYEVADVYTAFENSVEDLCNGDSESMNFDFHPNAAGHQVIAGCVKELLTNDNENQYVTFVDVNPDDWFYEAVQYVTKNKLCNGVSENEFAPGVPLTRAMFVTILHRSEGLPLTTQVSNFADVSGDSYYNKAVEWAAANGIVTGYSDTMFAPDDYITREQIAAIMLRYANYKGAGPVGAWAIRLDYTDLAEVSDYAAEAVMYCTMKEIMQGIGEGKFAPKDYTTRAEAVVIMKRFFDRIS